MLHYLTISLLKELREGIKVDVAAVKDEKLSYILLYQPSKLPSLHMFQIADIETSLMDMDGHGTPNYTPRWIFEKSRNSIRVTGLEERIERNQPTAFMEKHLTEAFVDHANRTLRPPLLTGLVNIHYYQDKEQILKMVEDVIYPNLGADLLQKRCCILPGEETGRQE